MYKLSVSGPKNGDLTNQRPLRKYWHELQTKFMCDAQKTTMEAVAVVSLDAALASVLLELERISLL